MLAAVAAVLTGISAAAPEGPAMITVVKAKSQLPGGTVLSAAGSRVDRVAASDVPEGALTDPLALIGKTLAGPVAKNQMMTPLTMIAARSSVSPGNVIAPLRLADTALAALLRPGDVVDVIAADTQAEQAVVVAAGARVVTIPNCRTSGRSRSGRCTRPHRGGCPDGFDRGQSSRFCYTQHHLAVARVRSRLTDATTQSLALLNR